MPRTRDKPDAAATSLEPSIAEVYGGPLDGFVARRDALVRELRSADRKDEAAEVKALRKPKALAWALDAGALADPDAFAELDAAVSEVSEAQDGGGDVRAAIARLRAAEDAAVAAADAAAREHDHPVDRTSLASGLRAVVGSAAAMDALRAGRLVDTTPPADDGDAVGEEMWAVPEAPRKQRAGSAKRTARGRGAGAGVRGDRESASEAGPPRVDPKALRRARREVEAAERADEKAAAEADRADTAADEAEAAARAAEEEAVAARRRADELADAARRARDDAGERAAERDETAAELARARTALDELSPPDG